MARVSQKTRASALADLHAGEQPAIVAERHGLDAATVRKWKERYVTSVTPIVTHVTAQHPLIDQQQAAIGVLVIDLLATKLKASAAIAKAAENTEWLAWQTASELATFGAWLDSTALDIGDRLAHRANDNDD